MEDAHTHLLSLPGDKDASFFGVFDGHGGKIVVKVIAIYLSSECEAYTVIVYACTL